MANCGSTFTGTDVIERQPILKERGLRSRQHFNENHSKKKKKRHQKKKAKFIKQKQKKQLFSKLFNKSVLLNKNLPQQSFNNNFNMACNQWTQSYTNALVWQYKHQIAYWKSKAVSLEYENKVLHDIIKSLYTQKNANGSSGVTFNKEPVQEKDAPNDFYYNEVNNDVELSNDDFTHEDEEQSSGEEGIDGMEISEAFMSFLEQNVKHKLELQEERKKRRESETESDIKKMEKPPCEKVAEQREVEMKMLYGESSNIIIGLESAVQLNFDRYMDKSKPVYWPNIPLKL